MEDQNNTQHWYLLAISVIALIIIIILMAIRDSWLSALPVYILGSLITLYAIWRLTEPTEQ